MSIDAKILFNKGYFYYTGTEGFPLNYERAFDYFQQAADLGLSAAMNYVGLFYAQGLAVPKNPILALEWYNKALQADSTNASATYNLAQAYYCGYGTPCNMVKAYEFAKRAIELGIDKTHSTYPHCCYLIGCTLMNYYKNDREAVSYLSDAAEYGDLEGAWYYLGLLCERGAMNIDKSNIQATALSFYKKAAQKRKRPEILDAIGRIYCSAQMFNEAKPWLEKAATMGYEPSKKRLKLLNVSESGSLWGLIK